MDIWISALAGVVLLLSAFTCFRLKRKTGAPMPQYSALVLSVLAALCFFYCIAVLLLAGID